MASLVRTLPTTLTRHASASRLVGPFCRYKAGTSYNCRASSRSLLGYRKLERTGNALIVELENQRAATKAAIRMSAVWSGRRHANIARHRRKLH
jgi:hypothetical protein